MKSGSYSRPIPYTQIVNDGSPSTADGRLKIDGDKASWIPNAQYWETIKRTGNVNKVFVVQSQDVHTVMGVPFRRVATGPYWSNSFAFTVTP